MKPLDAEFWPQLPAERSEFIVQRAARFADADRLCGSRI